MQQENYDDSFLKIVYSSPVITITDLVQGKLSEESSVRVTYRNRDQFKSSAKSLGLMDDFKVNST
jgi:alpha-1,3-mannosyl-glycoprotein beta-1,2-N-acetylglucosaminyltransferase